MLKRLLPLALFALLGTNSLFAQLPSIEIQSVHPPILLAGSKSEISLRGAHLDELTGIHFSSSGIKAKPILLPTNEFHPDPRQDGTRFEVTIPADHSGGWIETRATGRFGISPSRPVFVARKGEKILSDNAGSSHHDRASAPALPKETYAHGTADANQIDWWKVDLKKGERVLVHCFAEQLDSQADASLKLVDASGRELEASRDFVGRDPMIDFTASSDGSYWVGVYDFLYRGGENFPYLIQVSQRPWIDAVDPPVGQQGQVLDATLLGRLLPGSKPATGNSIDGKPLESLAVKIPIPGTPTYAVRPATEPSSALIDTFSYSVQNSLPVSIGISSHPVTKIQESADPTPVDPNSEVVTRIDKNGDVDRFRLLAKKGTQYFVEITGNRIDENFDPYLVIEKVTKDKDGKETKSTIQEGDDFGGYGGATFPDRSLDPTSNFIADQDGPYDVTVINQFGSGSDDMIYRLAIREATPDFAVMAVSERDFVEQRQAYPAAPLLRKGGTFPMRLLIYRKDGFSGPITIRAENLPTGVSCPPVTARAKETVVRLVFSASSDAPAWSGTINLTASTKIGDEEKKRPVRNGSLVFGVGDYNTGRLISRVEESIPLAVVPSDPTPIRIDAPGDRTFSVTLGEKLEIPIQVVARNAVKGDLTVTPVGLRGLTKPPSVKISDKANEAKLTLNFTKQNNVFQPEPGIWNFVLKGTGVTPYARNPESVTRAKEKQKRIDILATGAVEKVNQATQAVEAARKAVESAQKNFDTASPETKPKLESALVDARAKLKASEEKLKQAEEYKASAEKEKAAIAKKVTDLTKQAAKKDLKFASWSLPLTVEVKEPAPKPEKK
ncbi:MAG: hypothetical protein P1U85_13065 [Verrucomicrobiales bacterium]|nr:hypothetical protein [Verrucomicrobiales bacterium]